MTASAAGWVRIGSSATSRAASNKVNSPFDHLDGYGKLVGGFTNTQHIAYLKRQVISPNGKHMAYIDDGGQGIKLDLRMASR